MTVAELEERMTSEEFSRWVAFRKAQAEETAETARTSSGP